MSITATASTNGREADARQSVSQSPPPMNICIMIVGTRGDVEPFVAIAKRLQADGHRVRIATHAVYRDLVAEQHGIEFYPLGGDPKVLSAYMVKTGGKIAPLNPKVLLQDVPRNVRMIKDICYSTWPAATAPDPDGDGEPFRAHAIISNPVTYGHVHVAERLGVPLHIMSPQPCVPTSAFPHPLSSRARSGAVDMLRLSKRNLRSYRAVYLLMWFGSMRTVNRFRAEVLGLRKIRLRDRGHNLLLQRSVPHSFLWSPALVPQPADWRDIYDVVGTATLRQAEPKTGTGSEYSPSPELSAFLAQGAPVFVGFGSMVIDAPQKTTAIIVEAARLANVRVLIQSSWSDMVLPHTERDEHSRSSVCFVGDCPHDWLLPQVSAVVHHGGAGTTAAGLLAGKPTLVVPFFSDQFFWGRAVATAGAGPDPCRIRALTVQKLRAAFESLQCATTRATTLRIRDAMLKEDGVEGAVASFYHHL
ncbi:hypothetical protein PybrP1_007885 [[Pythium] brassicae (nom. inval.)]|nr:hypothetical protein PybrP1_007885 [[Pythium] brassicae (nom. inval.)]